MDLEEKRLNSKFTYNGKILDIYVDEVSLPNGKTSFREYIKHPGATAILAVLDNGNILMVKQYRYPAGDVLLEIPAGRINENEDPASCAVRELEEETGYRAGEIVPYMDIFLAPGYSNEKIYVYLATNLKKTSTNWDDDEFLEILEIEPKKIKEMILNNEIPDSKTAAVILKYCVENNI